MSAEVMLIQRKFRDRIKFDSEKWGIGNKQNKKQKKNFISSNKYSFKIIEILVSLMKTADVSKLFLEIFERIYDDLYVLLLVTVVCLCQKL